MRGVTEELARAGAVVAAEHRGDFAYDDGVEAAISWAREGRDDYSAAIAANDMMAIGVKDALVHRLGRRVPDEVEVAGFDAVEPSRWLSHDIASVEQPIDLMAKAAAAIMAARFRGERLIDPSFAPDWED